MCLWACFPVTSTLVALFTAMVDWPKLVRFDSSFSDWRPLKIDVEHGGGRPL